MPNKEVIVGGRFGLSSVRNGKLQDDFTWSRQYDVTDVLFSEIFGLVLATNNSGIILSKGDSHTVISSSNSLASNKVHCLLELDNGVLLIGTNNGLNYLCGDSQKVHLISENQGVTDADIISLYETDEFVFVGAHGGVYRLNKSIFERDLQTSESEIYLEDVFVDGSLVEEESRNFVYLPFETGRLRVRFRTNNYKRWVNKRYQYRLSSGESWIDIQSPEIVIYRPLGRFNIEVRYLNENDEWSKANTILKCNVHIPFWKKWYFIVLLILIVSVVIFSWILSKQRSVRRKLEMENEMLSLEQRMQNTRMNPHFVFNVLNSIHSFIVFGDKASAENYLVKFSELMRNTLDEAMHGTITVEAELTIIEKYLELEKLRSGNRFEYKISVVLENNSFKIPTMIIQPILENAIIHGVSSVEVGGLITIQISQMSNHAINISIFNNGLISDDQLERVRNSGMNNAIGITAKRLENYNTLYRTNQFGMSVDRVDSESSGTEFKLIVPLIQDI